MRKFSLFLATIVMLIMTNMPMYVSAQIQGDGSTEKPFMITNEDELLLLSDFPEFNFILMNDIELTKSWNTIGTVGDNFSGTFDGNGHTLYNLTNTMFNENNGEVKNLSIVNTNSVNCSILCKYNSRTIEHCYVNGIISIETNSGGSYAGIAGDNGQSAIIRNCSAELSCTGTIKAYSSNIGGYIGGIVGQNLGLIESCRTQGDFNITVSGNSYVRNGKIEDEHAYAYVGGIAGGSCSSDAVLSNCLSKISITTAYGNYVDYTRRYVGGIVGTLSRGTVQNCYSTGKMTSSSDSYIFVGGAIGSKDQGEILDVYYDMNTSNCSDTEKGKPKSTLAMKMKANYNNWDFENIWAIDSEYNDGYPYLRWERETENGTIPKVSGFDAVLNKIGNHIIVTANVPDDDISKNIHAALYSSNGVMLDYMIYPAEYSNNTVHFMFKNTLDLSYIKVFLWNGFENIIPLDESIVLNISK